MNNKHSLKSDSFYKLLNNIFKNGSKILLFILLARLLDKEEFSLYIFIFAVIELTGMLSNIGIPTAATNFISNNINDKKVFTSYISLSIKSKLLTTVIATLVALIYLVYFDYNITIPFMITIIVALIFFNTLNSFTEYIFTGMYQYKKYFYIVTLPREIGILLLLLYLYINNTFNLFSILLAHLIVLMLSGMLGYSFIYKIVKSSKKIKVNKKVFYIFALTLAPTTIGESVLYWTDTFMINHLLDVSKLAEFNTVYRLISIGITLFPVSSIIMLSYVNTLNLEEKRKRLKEIIHTTIILIIPLVFTLTLFSKEIIYVIYGKSFTNSYLILSIAALLLVERIISPIIKFNLISIGKNRNIIFNLLFTIIVNIILNYFLIGYYGVKGAMIATVISGYISLSLYIVLIKINGFTVINRNTVYLLFFTYSVYGVLMTFSDEKLFLKLIIFIPVIILYFFISRKNLSIYKKIADRFQNRRG